MYSQAEGLFTIPTSSSLSIPRQSVFLQRGPMKRLICLICALSLSFAAMAQTYAPAKATLVSHQMKAINYRNASSSKVDMQGTELMPTANGEANVKSRTGRVEVDLKLSGLEAANRFGMEYLTYVMWAISPQGRAVNMGELVLDHGQVKLKATTELQTFGLVVTAEPYFAVTQPSDVVVAENFLRNDTSGTIEQVDAKYELLQRGQYILNRSQYKPPRFDPKGDRKSVV